MRDKIIVEFAGISGAGKTKLAEKVVSSLRSNKDIYNNLFYIARKKIKFRNLKPLIKSLYLTLKLRPISFMKFIKLYKKLENQIW